MAGTAARRRIPRAVGGARAIDCLPDAVHVDAGGGAGAVRHCGLSWSTTPSERSPFSEKAGISMVGADAPALADKQGSARLDFSEDHSHSWQHFGNVHIVKCFQYVHKT
jgi:hypothetical protein